MIGLIPTRMPTPLYQRNQPKPPTAKVPRKKPVKASQLVTANGETKSAADWAKELGCQAGTITKRIREGMAPEEAVTKKPVYRGAALAMGRAKYRARAAA